MMMISNYGSIFRYHFDAKTQHYVNNMLALFDYFQVLPLFYVNNMLAICYHDDISMLLCVIILLSFAIILC